MPATGRQIHIDTPLSNVLVAAFETDGDFVASRLFPVVPVDKRSNVYYTLKKEAWLKQPRTARAPRTPATRVEFDVTSDTYFAFNWALAGEIPMEDLANADAAIRLRETTTRYISRGLLADLEIRTAAKVLSNVSTISRLTGADAWDATNSADLLSQVGDAHLSIFNNTGLRPNTLMMDYQSYIYARRNARLLARFAYGNAAGPMITDEQLRQSFMVDNLWVARSQKNNANENQTGSYTSIWGPMALLARVEPGAPSMMTATYGLSYRWVSPELGVPMAVTTSVEDNAGSRHIELLEGSYHQDEKVIASALAYAINTKSGTAW